MTEFIINAATLAGIMTLVAGVAALAIATVFLAACAIIGPPDDDWEPRRTMWALRAAGAFTALVVVIATLQTIISP